MRFRIVQLTRTRRDGAPEAPLDFEPGVNLLVAPPNGGKTTWLQMLNHLLGSESYPTQAFSSAIVETYSNVGATLIVGTETVSIERRWHESRNIGKIYWNGAAMQPAAFQKRLLKELDLPLLDYPRTDTLMSPAWPTLSFRMLFRHLYRQQRFWTDIVDKQPEPELFASLLVFMGLSEAIFTPGYREFYRMSATTDELRDRINTQQFAISFLARLVIGRRTDASRTPKEKVEAIEARLRAIADARAASSRPDLTLDEARELGRIEMEHDILLRAMKYARRSADDFSELANLEDAVGPLFEEIERSRESQQLVYAAAELSAGMLEYLNRLNDLRPGTWPHREPNVSFRRNKVVFDVGARRWNQALGGTDSLYFLVAYHYALLRSSCVQGRQVPGLMILDLPAEFAGEDIAEHENFIVRPFVELARDLRPDVVQLIVAGASFKGIEGCNFVRLGSRHLA